MTVVEDIVTTATEALNELGIFPAEDEPLETQIRLKTVDREVLTRHLGSQWLCILALAQHLESK